LPISTEELEAKSILEVVVRLAGDAI